MIRSFAADLRFWSCGRPLTPWRVLQGLVDNYGLQALLAYRLGRWLLATRWQFWWWPFWPFAWLFYYLLSRYVRLAFDIQLRLSAQIGRGFFIGHFGGILLQDCQLGNGCAIAQSVEIRPAADGHQPVIGNRVWIGAHAKIIGPYQVGSHSTISAGAQVRRNIPERTLCMGNPARIVMRDYDNQIMLRIHE